MQSGDPAISKAQQDASRLSELAYEQAVKKLGVTPLALTAHPLGGDLGKGPTVTTKVNGVAGVYVLGSVARVGKFGTLGGKVFQLVPTAVRDTLTRVVQCGCTPRACPPTPSPCPACGGNRRNDHIDKEPPQFVFGPLPVGVPYGGDLAVRVPWHEVSLEYESTCPGKPCDLPKATSR